MTEESQISASECHHEAGFTLVELLVALALFTFITVALSGSLHFGIVAWGHGTAQADRGEHVMFVQTLLRRLIADAYPRYLSSDPTNGHVDFDGTATSLDFLASAPIALAGGGRSRFTVSVDRRDSRNVVVLTSRAELANDGDASATTKTILVADVEALEFSYFGGTGSDNAPQWHDSWLGKPVLPALVRTQIRFPPRDARVWPDLVIAPRMSVDVGCVYDPLSRRCRGR
jgi:general secretion pathway protein J